MQSPIESHWSQTVNQRAPSSVVSAGNFEVSPGSLVLWSFRFRNEVIPLLSQWAVATYGFVINYSLELMNPTRIVTISIRYPIVSSSVTQGLTGAIGVFDIKTFTLQCVLRVRLFSLHIKMTF